MRLLLDTHAFLWFVLDEPQLSSVAKELIADPNNQMAVSPATYWKIAIKISIGKYVFSDSLQEFLEREIAVNRFNILAVEPRHVAPLTTLPFHHKDPFDRILIAQAIVENIPLVSNDSILDAYPIRRLW